jgi:hypothetical protein
MGRPSASLAYPSWLPLIGDYADIALFRGKILCVTSSGELISHDLFIRRRQSVITACDEPVNNAVHHLVVSADKEKLMMVRWSIPPQQQHANGVLDDHLMDLQVLEADLAKGQWSQVQDLGGQSVFVSKSCCRAVVSTEGNRVYVLGIDWHLKRTIAGLGHVLGGVPTYCVYDMMTRTLSLVSLGGGHLMENATSEWFFPCE